VLDAGHGGIDGGMVGVVTGTRESNINLSLAYIIKEYLEKAGIKVVMTRTDENGLYGTTAPGHKRRDMLERKKIILDTAPDIVISIHMNRSPVSSRRGAQIYIDTGDKVSPALATLMQNKLNTLLNQPSHGRSYEVQNGDFYILNCNPYPSVIIECGFLSNAEDDRLFGDGEYRRTVGRTIYLGAVEYLAVTTNKIIY